VRVGDDGTGGCRAVAGIISGLRWKAVQNPVVCGGEWDGSCADQAKDLDTATAAGLEMEVFLWRYSGDGMPLRSRLGGQNTLWSPRSTEASPCSTLP
jgi:hypothetical protein